MSLFLWRFVGVPADRHEAVTRFRAAVNNANPVKPASRLGERLWSHCQPPIWDCVELASYPLSDNLE